MPIEIWDITYDKFRHTRDMLQLTNADMVLGIMTQETTFYLLSSVDRIAIQICLDYYNFSNSRVCAGKYIGIQVLHPHAYIFCDDYLGKYVTYVNSRPSIK